MRGGEEGRRMAADGECSAPATTARTGPAARSHSEAERKRRQRINAHLATLRTLVPSASRMEKAALLGEVVRRVRELQAKASEAAEGVVILPGERDEIGVVEVHSSSDDHWRPAHHHHCYGGAADRRRQPRRVRAWVCCADRPGLLSDLGRAVRSASAGPVRAEIATVGGRTRSVLELDVCTDGGGRAAAELSTLRAVLRNVLAPDRSEQLPAAAAEGCKRPRFSAQIGEVQ